MGWCHEHFCVTTLRLIPWDTYDDKVILVQVTAWCRQATRHYLSQCWLRSMLSYMVTRPQYFKSPVILTVYSLCMLASNKTSKRLIIGPLCGETTGYRWFLITDLLSQIDVDTCYRWILLTNEPTSHAENVSKSWPHTHTHSVPKHLDGARPLSELVPEYC